MTLISYVSCDDDARRAGQRQRRRRHAVSRLLNELPGDSASACRLPDDVKTSQYPVPETLETIAATIDALGTSNDKRFSAVDRQNAETRAQLGVKIETVETKVVQVDDEVILMREDSQRNATTHRDVHEAARQSRRPYSRARPACRQRI